MRVLVVNAGSSSLKLSLLDGDDGKMWARGRLTGGDLPPRGAGASLCAVLDGRSVDTTMGFTPLEGLVMATRSGYVDPGLLLWLQQHRGLSADVMTAAPNGLDAGHARPARWPARSGPCSAAAEDLRVSTDELGQPARTNTRG